MHAWMCQVLRRHSDTSANHKKLEELMTNSAHNQVKSSILGAVTQGR